MEAAYAEVDLAGLEPVTVLVDAGGDPVLITVSVEGFSTVAATPASHADVALRSGPEA